MTTAGAARFRAVAIAAVAAATVAILGGTVTDLGPWYQGLAKPAWQPPGVAFGVIWTIVFALAATSGATAWRSTSSQVTREWTIGLFAMNGFLNVLWSLLFFRLRHPDWALVEVAGLWASIGLLMVFLARTSWTASLLLAPYLLWVSIAAVLNFDVVQLNPSFR